MYLVEKMSCNLLSVSKAGYKIMFANGMVNIFNSKHNLITIDYKDNELYIIYS